MWSFLGRCVEAAVITVVTIATAKIIEAVLDKEETKS